MNTILVDHDTVHKSATTSHVEDTATEMADETWLEVTLTQEIGECICGAETEIWVNHCRGREAVCFFCLPYVVFNHTMYGRSGQFFHENGAWYIELDDVPQGEGEPEAI
jgi:hypothetical protein